MPNIAVVECLLSSGLSGQVIAPSDPGFDKARRVWNGVADRRPTAIVRALTADDIRKTIQIAATQGVLLAVRCGGHSLPGLSTCDDGIVLDLSRMNNIQVDADLCLAKVSGGALLGDLDRSGEPFGLVVPAGVVSHTGAAGLTLGGGMGWLSRRFGLTIDSVVSMNLITASGKSVTVNADNEPELFWGLRGGGGNFGVVTEFTYKMHPLGPVWSGKWRYPFAKATEALQMFGHLASKAPRELTSSFNLTDAGLTVTALWSGVERFAGVMLWPFGKLTESGEGEFGETRFVSHQSQHDELLRWGRRYYSKGGFFHELTEKIIDAMVAIASAFPTEDSDIYVLQLGGAVHDVDDSATPYTGRAAGFYWITSACWDHADDDKRCIAWGRAAAAELAKLSMSGNYVNEQGEVERDVAVKAYGTEKYRRLQQLKARYDPGNLFRLNQNIEPAPSG